MNETNDYPLTLSVSFYCLHAADFDIDVELVNENRMQGLLDAWNKAFEHYSSNKLSAIQKQFKRKLGSSFSFHDLSDVVISFVGSNGIRDEIRVKTNYPTIG